MTEPVVRGTQAGYNICNSTTQNQQSECQTAIVNNIWGTLRFSSYGARGLHMTQTFAYSLHRPRIRRSLIQKDMKSPGALSLHMVLA